MIKFLRVAQEQFAVIAQWVDALSRRQAEGAARGWVVSNSLGTII